MALNGPLQGHLIGVSTFTNSGIIDLQSNPVAGDVLVITGSRTAGVAGTSTFITGGTLKLDTVLNKGGPETRSDTLVVDGTRVGSGPTQTAIRNAGGPRCADRRRWHPGGAGLGSGPLRSGRVFTRQRS
jgi:hypothetical protein